jgi:hypothetical protein
MRPHLTNRQLKELMEKHKLTRQKASELCMLEHKSALDRYLAPRQRTVRVGKGMEMLVDNPQYRRFPRHRMRLLEVNLASLLRSERDANSPPNETE